MRFLTKSGFLRKIYKRKKQIMEKELKEIKGFKGYFITNCGEIYSNLSGKLKQKKISKRNYKKKNDYSVTHLMKEGKRYKRFIHRLVWDNWGGDIPYGYEINHLDFDKSNNCIDNLECITRQENIQHYLRNKNKC